MPQRNRSVRLEEVQARFEQWRQNRKGRAAIPGELWAAAIELARRDGVNRTAAALRLDGGKLKRQMAGAETSPRKAKPLAFVELLTPRSSNQPQCIVELEGRHGKLRIQWSGATAADVAAVSRALWEVAS
jgi:hypothetical protein